MAALQLAGEEVQGDARSCSANSARAAAAEPFVLVDDQGDGDARISRAGSTARSSSGRLGARVEIFSEPGLRSARAGTLSALARASTSRKRAVWC
ncbi:hypothetical protein [Nonomuraea sp. NPDC005650]|uniref:hypothetical protein n=1 Tax=Nonomuraea sp. NPDC005650 TaxID=3157045 RepID=UPI0033A04547